MQNIGMTISAAVIRMAEATPTAMPDSHGISSGQYYFIFLIGMVAASVLLYRSMKKQLGRIQMPKDER